MVRYIRDPWDIPTQFWSWRLSWLMVGTYQGYEITLTVLWWCHAANRLHCLFYSLKNVLHVCCQRRAIEGHWGHREETTETLLCVPRDEESQGCLVGLHVLELEWHYTCKVKVSRGLSSLEYAVQWRSLPFMMREDDFVFTWAWPYFYYIMLDDCLSYSIHPVQCNMILKCSLYPLWGCYNLAYEGKFTTYTGWERNLRW